MTNALQVGMGFAGTRTGQGLSIGPEAGTPAAAGESFAALLDGFGAATPMAGSGPIVLSNPALADQTALPGETQLGDMLSQLLEKLASLEEALEDGVTPDSGALEEIGELLAGIDRLLAAADFPMPGGAAFETLDRLAANLGLTVEDGAGPGTNPFDVLGSLARRIANAAEAAAPELSAALRTFASLADGHAVRTEAVIAQNAGLSPDARKVVLLGEVQSNPATDIELARMAGQAPGGGASVDGEGKPAGGQATAGFERTLAKAEPATGAANGQRPQAPMRDAVPTGAAQAAADLVSAEETPDTVILPAGTQNASSATTLGARAAQPAVPYAQPTQVNMPYVAAEITRQVMNGVNRFEIRLNPPELGRIDVRMEMDQSGNVVARLAVEKSETLDLMQRDQRALERALADAGLDAAKTELEFSLRQDGGENAGDEAEPAPWRVGGSGPADDQTTSQPVSGVQAQLYRSYVRSDAVNLWV